jgi:hypothetical protein
MWVFVKHPPVAAAKCANVPMESERPHRSLKVEQSADEEREQRFPSIITPLRGGMERSRKNSPSAAAEHSTTNAVPVAKAAVRLGSSGRITNDKMSPSSPPAIQMDDAKCSA